MSRLRPLFNETLRAHLSDSMPGNLLKLLLPSRQ